MKEFCPHNYQQYCIDRIIRDPALGLFLDMGLGKTAITLTAIKRLMTAEADAAQIEKAQLFGAE